ncbi:plasma-membrane choline transporter-domain-containing protein [Chytriomyces sp. MP71]|nr:plasma-membrane choline transporter-domain-containing protein [Chytriomyces sp. MP71]
MDVNQLQYQHASSELIQPNEPPSGSQQQYQHNTYPPQQHLLQTPPDGGPSGAKPCNPVPPPNPPKIVERPKWNDTWATLLFAIFMVGFAVLAALGMPLTVASLRDGNLHIPDVSGSNSSIALGLSSTEIGGLIGVSVGTGLVFSATYFILMLSFPGPLIKFSYLMNVLMLVGMAAYLGYLRSYIAAAIFAVFAVLVALSYWVLRHRIPFSTIVLETVCKITRRFSGTLLVALGGVIFSAAYAVLWLGTVIGMAEWSNSKSLSSGVMIVILILLVFMSFWFNEVVRNTVHTAVCGTFATQPNSESVSLPSNHTTANSLGRALMSSFGSICFGSLLVSIIRTMKFIAQMAKNNCAQDGNIFCCIVATCFECFFSCMANILEYFNKYAYTEIAIYGKPYCDAGRDAWNLFKFKGIDLVINDILIGYVLGTGSFLSAILCAFAGFLYVTGNGGLGSMGTSVGVYVGVCLISAFIGMWLFLVLLEVVDAGTAATFVCLAEDPATIQRQQPRFFAAIQERFPEISWGMQTISY